MGVILLPLHTDQTVSKFLIVPDKNHLLEDKRYDILDLLFNEHWRIWKHINCTSSCVYWMGL